MDVLSSLVRRRAKRATFVLGILLSSLGFAESVISVEVDRGEDLGQNFGSLFEARTADGQFVVGAGFSGLYNTYHRADRHMLHFYIRPTSESRPLTSKVLPRSSDITGTYLFNVDGKVYSTNPMDGKNNSSRPGLSIWDESTNAWKTTPNEYRIDTRLGKDLLSFDDSRVLLNEKVVLAAPKEGRYLGFYYAQGHLFFYHILRMDEKNYKPYTNDSKGYSKLYACPWSVGDGAIELSKAAILTVPIVGEFPYAYGQLENQVLSCTNIGGGYAFRDGKWRTVVEGELKSSYQIYTMLTYYDQLLMGHYPSGELFAFDGEHVSQLEGWPPVIEGVSPSAREAQTMAIYGGELFVGVWPWGEVWKYHEDLKQWDLAKRMFTHPAPTDETIHPYENETAALGGVANQWGQRVTSMVQLGDSMLISTSAKWPSKWDEKFEFINNDRWKEYGAVTEVKAPGHLSVPVRWTQGTTNLRFILDGAEMRIEQDGKVIGSAKLSGAVSEASTAAKDFDSIKWGQGAYGMYSGVSLKGNDR